MRLKGLEMQGFKSFADRTVLDFKDGVTAVVGPNGSGKSNISDAIRWVMGEMSAKSLRGGNMQDIIFSGTEKRKPLGFAEVSLIIDNADKALGVDFDEVVVTRRLFRSGESEYFINKSSVRLKDIHELFMDTGVGREGYSIIGQGKIAEIINTKSEDRRSMFEEAAGITKFRYRKEEAERKLSHTNENVLRVNDIITEIEGQIGPLKQQSEKAKKYLNLRDKLKVLEVNVALKNIASYKSGLEEVGKQVSDLTSQLDKIRTLVEEKESVTAEVYQKITDTETLVQQKREKLDANRAELTSFETDISVLKSRIEGNVANIKRIEQEIADLNLKYDEAEKSVVTEQEQINELTLKRDGLNSKHAELENQLLAFDNEERLHNENIDSINTEIIALLNEVANLRAKISNFNALIQSYMERKDAIDKDISSRSADLLKLKENESKIKSDYESALEENTKLQKSYDDENKELSDLASKLDKLIKEDLNVREELQSAVSRQKLLKDLEKSFDNYSRSVKAVMTAFDGGQLSGVSLYGTVASLVKVESKYTTAIEVSLGAAAQNIVTATEEDAKRAIEYLKKTKQGRATFLPVSAAKGAKLDDGNVKSSRGYIGLASELVEYDHKYKNVIEGLLGKVVVVDNIDNAVKIAKDNSYRFRIVTLSGELLAPGGSMSGGSHSHSSGLFARANELVELEKKIPGLQLNAESVSKELVKVRTLHDDKVASVDRIKADLSEKSGELLRLKSDLLHAGEFIESVQSSKTALDVELKHLDTQVAEMQRSITVHESEIEAVNSNIAAMEKEVEQKRSELGNKYAEREKITASINEVRDAIIEIDKSIGIFDQKIEMVNQRKQEISLNIGQKKENISEMSSVNEDIESDIEFKKEQIESLNEELLTLRKEIDDSENSRKQAQETIRVFQEEHKKLLEDQMRVQQEQGRVESKKARAEAELESIINRLWEDYELTVTTAEELKTDVPSDAGKQVNSLKDEIKSLGNINIDAIEEYKQVSERYEFLSTQRDDLVAAKKNLEQVIADMILIMKSQFSEKFGIINKHFGETFSELFGGGKAELSLTDPDDVLNSGVEINVQPPGKAVKSMLQLSGGEQAFVSIALLFAILKVRPSPFCVLDEIEAALDDVNVVRFAEYLKKFSKKSQFIVVTHRRGTMQSANILYGITMQEQGVSKLLSIDIDKVMEMKLD